MKIIVAVTQSRFIERLAPVVRLLARYSVATTWARIALEQHHLRWSTSSRLPRKSIAGRLPSRESAARWAYASGEYQRRASAMLQTRHSHSGSIYGVGRRFQPCRINNLEMVAQICPRWNRTADWLRAAEQYSLAA